MPGPALSHQTSSLQPAIPHLIQPHPTVPFRAIPRHLNLPRLTLSRFRRALRNHAKPGLVTSLLCCQLHPLLKSHEPVKNRVQFGLKIQSSR